MEGERDRGRDRGREGKRMTAKNRGVSIVYFVGGSAECVFVCVCEHRAYCLTSLLSSTYSPLRGPV